MKRKKGHELIEFITTAICAVVCGAEGWADIENFGNSNLHWLATFLELSNGISEHNTFGQIFFMIDAQVAYPGIIGGFTSPLPKCPMQNSKISLHFYIGYPDIINFGRYCNASARCTDWISSSCAKSAIVRASFSTR